MKILHIDLTEHETMEELQKNFMEISSILNKNGCQLSPNKGKAESNLKYQNSNYLGFESRVFWSSKESRNGKETFVLHEAIID